jgi:hypothetical protein
MGKILQFRLPSPEASGNTGFEIPVRRASPPPKQRKEPVVISAMPDQPFPVGHQDFRPLLQRDGLILMSWARWEDWRGDESFFRRYIVTWRAARGRNLHYATKSVEEKELASAVPERRADPLFYRGAYGGHYYLDDYSDKSIADYLYFAAPFDLGPATIPGFIRVLKAYGSTVDFDYVFTLGGAKKNEALEYLKNLPQSICN